jgi:arylsulfatase A-like enzyme
MADLRERDLKQPVPDGLTAEQERAWRYQRYIKDYLRCIASIDDNVGRVLDWVDEQGLTGEHPDELDVVDHARGHPRPARIVGDGRTVHIDPRKFTSGQVRTNGSIPHAAAEGDDGRRLVDHRRKGRGGARRHGERLRPRRVRRRT